MMPLGLSISLKIALEFRQQEENQVAVSCVKCKQNRTFVYRMIVGAHIRAQIIYTFLVFL